jgi:hypothetical protein
VGGGPLRGQQSPPVACRRRDGRPVLLRSTAGGCRVSRRLLRSPSQPGKHDTGVALRLRHPQLSPQLLSLPCLAPCCADVPLVGCVTRLTHQKGIHLIKHAAWRTLERGGQFVLLGSAPDPKVQVGGRACAARGPARRACSFPATWRGSPAGRSRQYTAAYQHANCLLHCTTSSASLATSPPPAPPPTHPPTHTHTHTHAGRLQRPCQPAGAAVSRPRTPVVRLRRAAQVGCSASCWGWGGGDASFGGVGWE